MNEHDLMDALEDRAADVAVGSAPIDVMTRTAGRARRRNGVLGGLAAAAVVAVAAVGVVQVLPDGGRDTAPDRVVQPADQPVPADVPPAGSTYVGLGRAAIAVPSGWSEGDVECNGVPKQSTWFVDVGLLTCAMASPFPADTDIVTISGAPISSVGWTPIEVDGERALRGPTDQEQEASGAGKPAGVTAYSVSVFLPSEDVTFVVQSSVSEDRVDELIAGIVVLDEHVGVPAYTDLVGPDPISRTLDPYLDRLEALGLEAEVVEPEGPVDYPNGVVVSVGPVPGTVVDEGSSVRVSAVQ